MTSLANHQSNEFTKQLIIGDAKTGKTSSLISLLKAGYKLRILDFDNLLEYFKNLVMKECPELATNVEFRTLRDKYKASDAGPVIDGKAKAFVDGVKMLDLWKYKDDDGTLIDLGKPYEWGPDTILVIDSLSRMCDAAYDWREELAPAKMDGRAVYGEAQDAIEHLIAGLTSPLYRTNVIVIAHVQYMTLPDGTTKGFPQGVGQKLSPKIPQYFSSVVLYTKSQKGDKRIIKTTSTTTIDLANPKPFEMAQEYPVETGLADFFAVLRGKPTNVKTLPKPAVRRG